MHHRHRVLGAAALCVAALAVRGGAAPAPSSLAPAVANPSVNPTGLEFTLKLSGDKTSFMQGETIPVVLTFSNLGAGTLKLNTFAYGPPNITAFASFSAEPKQGVVDPLGDLPRENFVAIAGRMPDPPMLLGAKPVEIPLVLNDYLRFDRPGTYTLRATTNKVIVVPEVGQLPRKFFFFGGNSTAISTPLTLQIVPANPKWQAEQVAAWRAFWAKKAADFARLGGRTALDTVRPANDLRYLNTRAAAQAMIDRLGQDEFPRSSESEAGFWRDGLIGFSDRSWLIESMKSAMKRPDYPVTQGFLDNLATLQTLQHGAQGEPGVAYFQAPKHFVLADWNLASDSLAAKTGRARAMTVDSLLELAWRPPLEKAPEVESRLPGLVAMVPDVFGDLPLMTQQGLISDSSWSKEWARVQSPRFAPALRRLWNEDSSEQSNSYHPFHDAILHRLYEVSPREGRALILKEMAAPHPRVSFEVLSLLPDERLPQLQNLWLSHLNQDGEDQDIAARLIGRYATEAIKAQVKAEYVQLQCNKMPSSSISQGLSRYLARVRTR